MRTASLKKLLEGALKGLGGIDINTVSTANAGVGYLFQHPDIVAKLGKSFGADWVVIGQHFKASFLYSDVVVQLIKVSTQTRSASYAVELKGNGVAVSKRSMQALAIKLLETLHRQ